MIFYNRNDMPFVVKKHPGGVMLVTKCMVCIEHQEVFLPITEGELTKLWLRWLNGESIQNVFHFLDCDNREILISQICGSCYDAMY